MKSTDKDIAEAWQRERNYAEVGRLVGMHRSTIRVHIMRMRAAGVDLPPPQKPGYTLTSERAREINELRHRKAGNGLSHA